MRGSAGWRMALATIALLAALPAWSGTEVRDPALLIEQIRSPVLDFDRAVALRNVDIEMGPGLFEVQRGFLFPATIGEATTIEFVFIGQARFALDPPDGIEAGQLELFTGERSLEAPVEEAVLVLSNGEAIAELLARPPVRELRQDQIERVEELHRTWLEDTERSASGVEASILKFLIGDEAFSEYFALWCRSFEMGEFVFQFDPEDQEQITLASFRPLEVTTWERMRLKHHIRVQQRKGRWLGVRVEDLGFWDIWLSTSWSPSQGTPPLGNVGFETEHYDLDVTIKRRKLLLEGTARLHLRAEDSGRRVVRLELMRDLLVDRVTDGEGRDLFFFRSGPETLVLLPERTTVGQRITLDVAYRGRALQWVQGKTHDLEETAIWYPHCGTVDRATYDVTLRWPKKYDVFFSGRLVEGGRDGDYRWERRRLEVPSIAVSFVLGEFAVEKARVGHVDLTVAFNQSLGGKTPPALRMRVVDTVADALEYFEQIFGPYPLDELTVVTAPREYSQSYLGFVALVHSLVTHPDPFGDSATWMRTTTISHEMAHQWWGNLIGWWSYRDQWLSEGMAGYSALLYDSHVSGQETDRLAMMSSGWRHSLSRTLLDGRTIESLGPIVLGNRLNSSAARNGYRTIVYRKGAVVLAMLARSLGEERFLEMLRSLVEVASGRVITTENFLEALEKMSAVDLDGFARQFVYGTGIPEVYYGFDLGQGDEQGWTVRGEARLLSAPRYRYEIVRKEGDRWDVSRFVGIRPDLGPTTLMVPYRVTLEARTSPGLLHQSGQLFLEGRHDGFEIATDHRPLDLELDPRGEILAWFYSADDHPKRVLRYQAEDLAGRGRLDEAETLFVRALESPASPRAPVDPLGPARTEPRVEKQVEDYKIRLALARLRLDQGRDEEAGVALDDIDAELNRDERMLFRVEREALRSRIEIRRGDYAPAFKRLKRTLRLALPRGRPTRLRDLYWQAQLNAERSAVTESFSLLAIAAHATGNGDEFRWALREARERGVDVSSIAASL